MRRQIFCAVVAVMLPVGAFATGVQVTTTPGTTAPGTSSTVLLAIPGIIGVDDESNVEFHFGKYTPGSPADGGCNANTWPPSINCTSGTIHLDANTAAGALGTIPAIVVAPSPDNSAGDTSIWLAVFCSEPTGTFKADVQVPALLSPAMGGAAPLNGSHIVTKRSAMNNANTVGFAAFTGFGDGATHTISAGNSLPATFGWTRADQAVALEFPFNRVVVSGNYTSSITYKVTK